MAGKPALQIIVVGKLRERYWQDAEAEYRKRLVSYTSRLTITEVNDEPTPDNASSAQETAIRVREGERILAQIPARDYVIALDRQGITLDSLEFSARHEQLMAEQGVSGFCYVIGGSLGLSPAVLARADIRLSFGEFTYPHQLMRIILLEQLYRAAKIARNEPYHK